MEYRWVLLQGDPELVQIKPLNDDHTRVSVTLKHPPVVPWVRNPGEPAPQGPKQFPWSDPDDPTPLPEFTTRRVDVGCFVHNGTHWSPPAMLSFYYLSNEAREYEESGCLLKIDYTNPAGLYEDPMLSLAKRWADVYQYDEAGVMLGWERQRGEEREAFTADGFKVETRDELGRPATARVVEYKPGGNHNMELLQSDSPRTVAYTYDGPGDWRGTFRLLDE